MYLSYFNTLRPRQNGRHFPDDIFKRIFLNENVWISLKISLKFVPKGPINNIPALVQIMAWRRPGDKPLSEAKLVSFLTHKCVTRPQWVKSLFVYSIIICVCSRKGLVPPWHKALSIENYYLVPFSILNDCSRNGRLLRVTSQYLDKWKQTQYPKIPFNFTTLRLL